MDDEVVRVMRRNGYLAYREKKDGGGREGDIRWGNAGVGRYPEKGGEEPFLDAAIVGWNMRDKKTADQPMTFLRAKEFAFTAGKHHFTPIYEQSKYKVSLQLLYVV